MCQPVVGFGSRLAPEHGVNLVKMIGIHRITLGIAPGIGESHFARRVGHYRERLVTVLQKLKAVFLSKTLHKFIVIAKGVLRRVLISRQEIGEARNILLRRVTVLILAEILRLRPEVNILAVYGVILPHKILNEFKCLTLLFAVRLIWRHTAAARHEVFLFV